MPSDPMTTEEARTTARQLWRDEKLYTEPEEGTDNWRVHCRTDPEIDLWSVVGFGANERAALLGAIRLARAREVTDAN